MTKQDQSDAAAAVGIMTLVFIVTAFLHLVTSDEVAFWTAATAVVTGVLGFIAWYQIGRLENAQKGWETLRVCGLYDVDPTIDRAVRAIMNIDENGDYTSVSNEATSILNYFTTLAIGIDQGFYIEKIVRAQLGRIIQRHAEDLLSEPHASQLGIVAEDFSPLRKRLERWRIAIKDTSS